MKISNRTEICESKTLSNLIEQIDILDFDEIIYFIINMGDTKSTPCSQSLDSLS